MVAEKTARTDYRIVTIAYIAFIALGLPGGMLGVAWPSMRDAFGVPSAALGTLLLTSVVGYLIAGLFNGAIVTRLGVGRTLVLSCLISAVGLLGYGIVPAWLFLVGTGVILGLGQGIIDAALNLYFASNFTARLMNWLHAAFGLGAALGPLVMTTLFSLEQSWRIGYFIMVAVQVALALIFFVTQDHWRVAHADQTSGEPDPAAPPILTTLRRPAVLLSILLFFSFTGAEATAGNWSFTLLTESRGIDVVTAGQWVSFYWWSFTLGRLLFGFFADRIPVRTALISCMLLMVGGSVLLSANISDTMSFVGLAVVGFALAPLFPLMTTTTPERLGRQHATNAIGFQVGAASLGLAVLPGIAGLLAQWTSLEIIGPCLIFLSVASISLFWLTQK